MTRSSFIRSFFLFLATLGLALSGLSAADAAGPKSEILATYLKISAALAADNFSDAQSAASALAASAGVAKNQVLADQAKAVAKAPDISTARSGFKALSASVEPLADGEKSCIVMFCPMAGADWIQPTGAVRNPYFGKTMLTCGAPKKAP